MESTRPSTHNILDVFSNDILFTILSWVSIFDLYNVKCTCIQFSKIILDPQFRKQDRNMIKDMKKQPYFKSRKRIAIKYGNWDLVQYYIKNGYDDWNQLMNIATKYGYINLVELSLKNGADLEWCLKNAAFFGHINIINLCIDNGAKNINQAMKDASEGGHKNLVELFIEKGANKFNDCMIYAVQSGNKDLVELFIRKGANNLNEGLNESISYGYINLVELFIVNGANNLQRAAEITCHKYLNSKELHFKKIFELLCKHGFNEWTLNEYISAHISDY